MRRLILLALLASCGPQAASPQANRVPDGSGTTVGPNTTPTPPSGPIFDSFADLTPPRQFTKTVRGARLVEDTSDWSASFYILAEEPCTATIIGEYVLLTAAHCVLEGGQATFRKAGTLYGGICNQAREYRAGGPNARTADFALCRLVAPVPDTLAERININPAALKVGSEVSLTGFGCTKEDGTGGRPDEYRIGEVKITQLPSGSNNDIVTFGSVGSCFGDSGGPAFIMGPGKKRLQVSVTSRAQDLDPGPKVRFGPESYLSSLTSPVADKFLKEWASNQKLRICGMHADARTCRG